jgi:hypothetical protein
VDESSRIIHGTSHWTLVFLVWNLPNLGANFIHGTDGNPLTDIAEKVGSTFVHNMSLRGYYDNKGEPLSSKAAGLVYQKVWEYNEAAVDYSRENEVESNKSMAEFCRNRLAKDKEVKDDMKEIVGSGVEMLAGIAACDLDKLSLKYYWMEEDLPVHPLLHYTNIQGDTPFIDSSYAPLLEYIAAPSTSRDLIKFNTEIISIDVNSSKSMSITLKSAKNAIFHADSVIVTIPLGLLQRKSLEFTPSLPPPVQKAISNLGFGVLEKLFIRFSDAWWLTSMEKREPIGLEFYRFSSLLVTAGTLPRGTLSFFSLARIHNPQPVFGIFVSTTLAKYLVSLPKTDLKAMLQTYYIPHLPNYDKNNPACQILELDHSSWSQDPLSGFGSYTHIPVGSDSGDGNMKVLSERILPAGNGGIWFAGEHTADTEVIEGVKYTTMATVTGAYKSGERAANHVIRLYS